MKLIVRHADGTKSEWQLDEKDPVLAIGIVSRFITAVTGVPPKTVLALIEDGKRDDRRNSKGAAPRKGRKKPNQMSEIES